MSPVDPALPMRHTATYRVRFDEATPRGMLRGSALLGYVQDVAWRRSLMAQRSPSPPGSPATAR
jgi:hypothetical protein